MRGFYSPFSLGDPCSIESGPTERLETASESAGVDTVSAGGSYSGSVEPGTCLADTPENAEHAEVSAAQKAVWRYDSEVPSNIIHLLLTGEMLVKK